MICSKEFENHWNGAPKWRKDHLQVLDVLIVVMIWYLFFNERMQFIRTSQLFKRYFEYLTKGWLMIFFHSWRLFHANTFWHIKRKQKNKEGHWSAYGRKRKIPWFILRSSTKIWRPLPEPKRTDIFFKSLSPQNTWKLDAHGDLRRRTWKSHVLP